MFNYFLFYFFTKMKLAINSYILYTVQYIMNSIVNQNEVFFLSHVEIAFNTKQQLQADACAPTKKVVQVVYLSIIIFKSNVISILARGKESCKSASKYE